MRGIIQVSVQRTNSYSFAYIFFTSFASSFICNANSLLKKENRADRWTDKKESILCFYWEFYEGNLSVTRTKKLNDSSHPLFQILHISFFLCMLAEGRVWDGGKQRQYHMVLLSQARLAFNIYNLLQCSSSRSVCLCGKETKRQREVGKAETHNGKHKKWGKDRKRGTKAGLEMHFTQPGSLLDGACHV